MLEPDVVSELLEAFADSGVARTRSKEVQTLRGIRGVPTGEIARLAAAVWVENTPSVHDEAALTVMFGTAWEDGLVAIGLLAAALPDSPDEAFDIAREWADRIDDRGTADALGPLLLGPGVLATGQDLMEALGGLLRHRRPAVRRAAVMAGLAMIPEEIKGPEVAPLRARMGTEGVMFVTQAQSPALHVLADASLRDPDPSVIKALRRVVGAWAVYDPEAAEAWMSEVKGGVPRIIKEAVIKGGRKGRRRQRLMAEAEAEAEAASADEVAGDAS